MLVKMSLNNELFCSLDDFAIITITNCNIPELEREFTLGEERLLQYTIIPASDFKNEENIKTKNFIFENKSYVFAYKIIDNL